MLTELRLAIRSLWQRPGFSAFAILILALGLGAATAVFSLVNALLLRPLPYPAPDELVSIRRTAGTERTLLISGPTFRDYREQSHSFTNMAAYMSANQSLVEPGAPAERVFTVVASAEFFPLLGARAQLGRIFVPEDHERGRSRVVVLSHALWQRRFGGDPAVLGRALSVDEETVTVVGVLPAGFNPPSGPWGHIDLWQPLLPSLQVGPNTRHNNWSAVIARLKPGVSLATARADLEGIAAALDRQYRTGSGVAVTPLAPTAIGDTEAHAAWLTLGLALLVLIAACTNLGGVQLARLAGRGHEHAIRVALGATRGRLVRQAFVESLLLSLGGALVGVLLASWATPLFGARLVVGQQGGANVAVSLDARVLGFALALALVTALAVGVLPAWLTAGATVAEALQRGGRGSTDRSQPRLRQGLVVLEMALALALLAAGGVFLRGIERFAARDLGWSFEHVVSGFVTPSHARYPNAPERNALFDRLHERLAAVPGATATLANHIPRGGLGFGVIDSFLVEGEPRPPAQAPSRSTNNVSPTYFSTLGIALHEGRAFSAADRLGSLPVAIVNRTMAQRFWPGQSAIGKRIANAVGTPIWTTIVGVVGDVSYFSQLNAPSTTNQVYFPLYQRSGGSLSITLRGSNPEALAHQLRRAVTEVDPTLAVHGVRTASENRERGMANLIVLGRIVSGLALLGLLLSALGVYALFAGYVTQRTREIGLRIALGAQAAQVLRWILGKGLGLALAGTALGLATASAVIAVLASIASELPTRDPVALVTVAALLLVTALLACWLPARRAAALDPMAALRHD